MSRHPCEQSRERERFKTEKRGCDTERGPGQTKAVATREKLLRQNCGFKERGREIVLYVATLKAKNLSRDILSRSRPEIKAELSKNSCD